VQQVLFLRWYKHQDNWVLHGKQLGKSGIKVKKDWLPHLSWVKSRKWKNTWNYSPFSGDDLIYIRKTNNKQRNLEHSAKKLIKSQKGFTHTYVKLHS
jgi:hypothetical protein